MNFVCFLRVLKFLAREMRHFSRWVKWVQWDVTVKEKPAKAGFSNSLLRLRSSVAEAKLQIRDGCSCQMISRVSQIGFRIFEGSQCVTSTQTHTFVQCLGIYDYSTTRKGNIGTVDQRRINF